MEGKVKIFNRFVDEYVKSREKSLMTGVTMITARVRDVEGDTCDPWPTMTIPVTLVKEVFEVQRRSGKERYYLRYTTEEEVRQNSVSRYKYVIVLDLVWVRMMVSTGRSDPFV